ncbi:MAG: hypothetical protein OEY70_16055, partial [Acidimicrobiia bacterium]|nr:hypothetical protein [Acidimicrobiia bacterium]
MAGALVAVACGSTAGRPGGGTSTSDTSADGGAGWSATDGSIVVGAEAGAPDLARRLGTRPALVAPLGMAADAAERARVEAETGVALPVVRVFARWDTPFPTADQEALFDTGRLVHLS